MKKPDLRKRFLEKRAGLSRADLRALSEGIGERLVAKFDFGSVGYLHHFNSISEKNEIELSPFVDSVRASFPIVRFVVPRIRKNSKQLEHVEITPETSFEVNRWGIPEPVGGRVVDEKIVDLVLVPLLCFDLRGHRVGYGGGYYDRFLKECRPDCLKIGLSIFGPVDEIDDVHQNDVRLDYCVTPDRVYDFRAE